jgi:hypothetical protein
MITVPTQEIAAFLGNHLDHVLQRTGNNFLTSVAADREFRAGCAIMDVLNAVESVQSSLRLLLEKNGESKGRPSEVRLCCYFCCFGFGGVCGMVNSALRVQRTRLDSPLLFVMSRMGAASWYILWMWRDINERCHSFSSLISFRYSLFNIALVASRARGEGGLTLPPALPLQLLAHSPKPVSLSVRRHLQLGLAGREFEVGTICDKSDPQRKRRGGNVKDDSCSIS